MKYLIEAGAFDGLYKSHTRWCDYYDDITCILIEPHPYSYDRLVQNRSKNHIYVNKVLTSFEKCGETIDLFEPDYREDCNIINKTNIKHSCESTTIQQVLDENSISNIEKLYLDIGGSEIDALNGIDFNKTNVPEIDVRFYNEDQIKLVKNKLLENNFYLDKIVEPNYEKKYIFKKNV